MKKHAALSMVMVILVTASVMAGTQLNDDEKLALKASDIISNNYLYTMFDYIQVEADKGILTLHGSVTEPRKVKDYILDIKEKLGKELEIVNEVKILPASFSDDRIRLAIRERIMRDDALLPYSFQRFPEPVHVLVKNGRVVLEGKAYSKMDTRLIEMKARSLSGVLSVENNLLLD